MYLIFWYIFKGKVGLKGLDEYDLIKLSLRGDSNPRPIPYQGIALPAEPLRQ